jgi:signal transduction histidine kinase
MLARGGVLGALTDSRTQGSKRFTAAELELVADFAGQASVAMKISDARADKQRMMLLEDRGRIAQDLHDHVIQQLFAPGLRLQELAGSLPAGPTAEGIDQSITKIDPQLAFSGPVNTAITGKLGEDVLAVIRKSPTNTVQQAHATHVSITVTVTAGSAIIEVVDDVVGIPDGGRRSGLKNLNQRAMKYGGPFTIDSTTGHTAMTWCARYAAEQEDN